MKRSRTISKPEQLLMNAIKMVHTTSRKLKDMTVKIKGKPYIKGFDIDIFIPSLNKGIEFDGKYHHTFEFMRKDKGKKLWSDEDIHNYHEIKDDHFLSKGIQILHIKEEDWNKDKANCVKRCLEFLTIT